MGNLAAVGRASGDLGPRGRPHLSPAPMESITEWFLLMKGKGGLGRVRQPPGEAGGHRGLPRPLPATHRMGKT